MKLDKILDSVNLANDLDTELLIKIGNEAVSGYETDLDSRKPWERDLKIWTELALQVASEKTFPWPNAANIKYPLLATAAMQFAARAYPTLVPSNGKIVKCKTVGFDPTGEKAQRAHRISTHMSYQIMDEMEEWDEDMDKLLIALPISGTCFKKTYWDSAKQRNCSKLVLPKSLVVNYWSRSLEDAERVTEVFYLSRRKVKERQNLGVFCDCDLGDPQTPEAEAISSVNRTFQNSSDYDQTTPYTFLEQHTYLDLDDDGYSEPYVVTVELFTKQVVRIVPRFSQEHVLFDEKQKVITIDPIHYYTKYGFIPNPDGGFYDIGFGRLLGPLNNSANTIINQLVDAGSLSNLQAGFIGKGLRIKMGESRFQPGEWKAVNAVGDDLKKQIFPLPVREPSQVLFNLLDLLLKSGKELASVAEIFVGKMPGQNTPATTTMATIEQGMKVFTAVYKRIYRSLTREFRKIYKLNRTYMNPEEYIEVLDTNVAQQDYQGSENDIIPGADPTAVSSQEKQAKVQAVMQLLQLGTINPMEATLMYLDAHEIPETQIQKLAMQPQPKDDPKSEALQAKAQVDAQKAQNDMQISREKLKMEQMSKEQELQHKAALQRMELEGKQMEATLKGRAAQMDMQVAAASHVQQLQQQSQQHQMNTMQAHTNHQMQMQHQQEANKQKLTQSKEKTSNAKPNKSK